LIWACSAAAASAILKTNGNVAWSWRRRRCRRRPNCGWSGTQQQHSTEYTKRTKMVKTTNPAKKIGVTV
jgi:hypothetical protein